MITNLKIENFKNLKSLDLKDLNRVTLITGPNNIGKSTILEAVFLLFNEKHPYAVIPAFANRIKPAPSMEFEQACRGVFYDFNFENAIAIRANDYKLDVKFHKHSELVLNDSTTNIKTQFQSDMVEGNYLFQTKQYLGFKLFNNALPGQTGFQYQLNIAKQQPKIPKVLMINSAGELLRREDYLPATKNSLMAIFNEVRSDLLSNSMDELLQWLSLIDPEIIRVELGYDKVTNTNHIELIKKGAPSPTPLRISGDGVKMLFNIVIGIISAKDGILLIDEIENGLYHEVLEKLWGVIFNLAIKYNCQVIATTHSYEVALYVVNEPQEHKALFSFVRLDKLDSGRLVSTSYSLEDFEDAIRENVEVR